MMRLSGQGALETSRDVLTLNAASVEGELVYSVGDIHGRYDLLKALLSQIILDSQMRSDGRRPILIFCGDYVDRGPDSAKVLEAVGWLKRYGTFETHLLMGNHERAMLDFIADPIEAAAWLDFGGNATLLSYGVDCPSSSAAAGDVKKARDDLLHHMPASHLVTLNDLEMILCIGDYAFVHAGVKPKTRLKKQTSDDLLWIRSEFLEWPSKFEKIIVHGHTWRDAQVQLLDHRIGLDTGAYETGVLSAVRLEDGMVEVLQAGT